MADDDLPIGNRRWLVSLARRVEANEDAGPGLTATYEYIADVWADVQPVGSITYYESIQTDQPITHRIFIRWRPDIRLFDCVIRNTTDPFGNSLREIYMIKRSSDWKGRKRFLAIEARLEERSDEVDNGIQFPT